MENLREQAEILAATAAMTEEHFWNDETRALVHELRVHQIELELQNEEFQRAQQQLHEAQHKYYALYDFAPVGYLTVDRDGLITEVNHTFCEMLALTKKEVLSRFVADFMTDDEQGFFHLNFRYLLDIKTPVRFEVGFRKADGSKFFRLLNCKPTMDGDGNLFSININVTEKNESNQIEYRLEHVLRLRNTELIEKNRQLQLKVIQHARSDASLKFSIKLLTLLNEETPEVDTIREIMSEVKSYAGVDAVAIRLKEGDDYPYYHANGFPDSFIQEQQCLLPCHADANTLANPNENQCYKCWCSEVIAGRTDPSKPYFTEKGSFWTHSLSELAAAETEQPTTRRNRCHTAGYETLALIPLHISQQTIGLIQLCDRSKAMVTPEMVEFFENVSGGIGIAVRRRKMEQKLLDDIALQKIMMREIDHRTKNNMQTIISILSLQASQTSHQETQDMLQQAQDRVWAMALIHQELYKFDLRIVNFGDYIQNMAPTLVRNYRKNAAIELKLDVKPVIFSVDKAIPCGLVLNELITNTMKYAFPNQGGGEICIGLRDVGDQQVELTVSDNGVGLPADLNIYKTKSLGYELITSITKCQLRGKIKVNHLNPGVEVIIGFCRQ